MPTNIRRILNQTAGIILLLGYFLPALASEKTDNESLKFIENKGQWDNQVLYAADIPGGRMFLTMAGITYAITDASAISNMFHHGEDEHAAARTMDNGNLIEIQRVDVTFLEANEKSRVTASKASSEYYNYFLGKDPTRWAERCTAFTEIIYEDLYPGIDLKLYSSNAGLKYDLILEKGADPSMIKIQYDGAQDIRLIDGEVHAFTKFNEITENKPFAYQIDKSGRSREVECHYKLVDNQITFEFPANHSSKQALVIDPALIFSTFSGSTAANFGFTACYDSEGSLYSGGNVFGLGFPVTNGSSFAGISTDIGILKYDSSGSRLKYATYIGGNSEEAPHSLIVNNNNELVIMGTTGSSDFPVSSSAYDQTFNGGTLFNIFGASEQGSDIIVTKLNATGSIIASTYVGGPGNDGVLKLTDNNVGGYINKLIRNYGDYLRGDIIMDTENNLYIASSTDSTGFPVTSKIQPNYHGGNSDAIVFSLNDDLSTLRWSTYLGGTDDDAAHSIKLDDQNNIVVGGGTASSDFPTTAQALQNDYAGDIDGFVTKLSQGGDSILQSTYLGTSSYDQVYFIDLDDDQNVYAFGQTKGNYPVTTETYNNPGSGQFIHKLNPDLDITVFSTVFGSGQPEPNISPTAFLVNECKNIFLSGWGGEVNNGARSVNRGNTLNMPITNNALSKTSDGSDFYLMSLSADGETLLYGSYFGNTNGPTGDHVDGGTSRFDKKGIIYQSVCSCGGIDDTFPTTPGSWSNFNRGECNNAAFKFDLASLEARIKTNSITRNQPNLNNGCAPLSVLFENNSIGGEELIWDFGDGVKSTRETNVVYEYRQPGVYTVTLTVKDDNTCIQEDITSVTIVVHESNFSISDPFQICEGEEIRLAASGGVKYEWRENANNPFSSAPSTIISPDTTTTFKITAINSNGCEFIDSVKVTVIPFKTLNFDFSRISNCSEESIIEFRNLSPDEINFEWDFGDGTTSIEKNPLHKYADFGVYNVRLTSQDADCVVDKFEAVTYEEFFVPNVFTPNNDHINEHFEIRKNIDVSLKVFDRSGKEIYSAFNYKNDWRGDNHPSGVYFYELTFPNGESCNSWVQILR